MWTDLNSRLQTCELKDYYRRRVVRDNAQGVNLKYGRKTLLNFCSNDYLGLANHPEVIEALQLGATRYGVGSGASQLITGFTEAHAALEQDFANFMGYERALVFGSGMLANLGVIPALMGKRDIIFADKYNHASLIDAVRLSRATSKRYAHGDVSHLEMLMRQTSANHSLIVSDGVFSMRGDLAPVPELTRLATSNKALLMIDDAHGIGVLGDHGRGVLEHFGLNSTEVPILVCPMGKALGGYGAVVLSNHAIIENLLQFARSFIYTTALPPAIAFAMQTSLKLMQRESWRRLKLKKSIAYFKLHSHERGLPIMPSDTAIQCLMLKSVKDVNLMSERLLNKGVMVSAIRAPTVPINSPRLRITLSATHELTQIEQLLDVLVEVYATLH